MYHDKTIYILNQHSLASVMGYNFFPGGVAPSPHRGGIAPHFFKIFFFNKIIYFLIEDTLLSILSDFFSRGVQFTTFRGVNRIGRLLGTHWRYPPQYLATLVPTTKFVKNGIPLKMRPEPIVRMSVFLGNIRKSI